MNPVLRAVPVQLPFTRHGPGAARDAPIVEHGADERALEIAAKGLAILAAQSGLAAAVLREMSETLGNRIRDGILPDPSGRFHAYADGVELGAFDTFDTALDVLCRKLVSSGIR